MNWTVFFIIFGAYMIFAVIIIESMHNAATREDLGLPDDFEDYKKRDES